MEKTKSIFQIMFKTKGTEICQFWVLYSNHKKKKKKYKSIAIKYRKHTKLREFIAAEVKKLLTKGIIEFFTSC